MYTAIIVEPRQHKALGFVLQNFLENLSCDWKIILLHGNKNIDFIHEIINSKLNEYKSRITLTNLKVDNLKWIEYSDLLKTKSFYDYIPTETFLIFQTDTLIFKQHKHLINQFLEYDYVGAPWGPGNPYRGHLGNGGLSLRKKSKMLEIIEKEDLSRNKNSIEDVFFSLPQKVNIYKPSLEQAKLFSVEEVFNEISFGCHKPWCCEINNKFFELYPEVKTLYELNN